MLLEICCNGLDSALAAQKAGADRIELCVDLNIGGITPSRGLIESVRREVDLPIYVLIRPRGGNFVYNEDEFDNMIDDIHFCKSIGVKGVVSGVLYEDFRVDIRRTMLLINAAHPIDFTFHRAFDEVSDPVIALKELEDIGVSRILSSGQERSAIEGLPLLQKLQKSASSVILLPGAGVNSNNIMSFKNAGFLEAHTSASKTVIVDGIKLGTVSDVNEISALLKLMRG